jgi:hypothetical protein
MKAFQAGFEVSESSMFWDIMPCSTLKVNRRFGAAYHLHLQVTRIRQGRNQDEAGDKPSSARV